MAAVTAAIALIAAGCAAYEPVGRPPTAGEIAHINSFAEGRGPMQLEYVEVDPIKSCAGGGCGGGEATAAAQGYLVIDPTRIESCDDRQITFRTVGGATQTIPTPLVAAVSARDRERGTLIGLAVGTSFGMIALIGGYFAGRALGGDPGAQQQQSSCGAACAVVIVPAIFGVLGAGLGYLIGSRRVFRFSAPAPNGR
jgi:hypothetical protein